MQIINWFKRQCHLYSLRYQYRVIRDYALLCEDEGLHNQASDLHISASLLMTEIKALRGHKS